MANKTPYTDATEQSDKNEMLSRLVNNAIDFLKQSVDELKEKPKYSVIHFHAAIELFLKARLMAEHWSLVVSSRKEADRSKFQSGDFVSVSLVEAATRLDKVVQSGLSKKQLSSFVSVTKHRNRMVHFFHEADSSDADQHRIQAIVKEQLSAWYFLHELVRNQWKNVFAQWDKEIEEIDEKLREHHAFLQVVFNEAEPEIEKKKKEGSVFDACPSCGFVSDEHIADVKEAYESGCLVCSLTERCIKIPCEECEDDGIITFRSEPNGKCDTCGYRAGPEDLIDALVDSNEAYMAARDGDTYPFPANCSECDGYHTVVELGEATFFCTQCFTLNNILSCCEWCSEYCTGELDNSFWSGCCMCDGRSGWEKDD